jgi:hypothetical protein
LKALCLADGTILKYLHLVFPWLLCTERGSKLSGDSSKLWWWWLLLLLLLLGLFWNQGLANAAGFKLLGSRDSAVPASEQLKLQANTTMPLA